MANLMTYSACGCAPSELTTAFACQLATIRQRLADVRLIRGHAAIVERRCLRQQEAAWQLGLLLLRRTTRESVADIIGTFDASARYGGPAGEAFAAMAAMIAIHSLWSAALHAPADHAAHAGLHG